VSPQPTGAERVKVHVGPALRKPLSQWLSIKYSGYEDCLAEEMTRVIDIPEYREIALESMMRLAIMDEASRTAREGTMTFPLCSIPSIGKDDSSSIAYVLDAITDDCQGSLYDELLDRWQKAAKPRKRAKRLSALRDYANVLGTLDALRQGDGVSSS
jgi:hypothetical protein